MEEITNLITEILPIHESRFSLSPYNFVNNDASDKDTSESGQTLTKTLFEINTDERESEPMEILHPRFRKSTDATSAFEYSNLQDYRKFNGLVEGPTIQRILSLKSIQQLSRKYTRKSKKRTISNFFGIDDLGEDNEENEEDQIVQLFKSKCRMFNFEGVFDKKTKLANGTGKLSILHERIIFEADFEDGLFSGPVSLKIKYPPHIKQLLDRKKVDSSKDKDYFYIFENLRFKKGQLDQSPDFIDLNFIEDQFTSKEQLFNEQAVLGNSMDTSKDFGMDKPIEESKAEKKDQYADNQQFEKNSEEQDVKYSDLSQFLALNLNQFLMSNNSDVMKDIHDLLKHKMDEILDHKDNLFLNQQFKKLGLKVLNKGNELLSSLEKMYKKETKVENPLELSTASELKQSFISNATEKSGHFPNKTTLKLVSLDKKLPRKANSKNNSMSNTFNSTNKSTQFNINYKPYEIDPTDKHFSGYAIYQYYTNDKYEGEWVKGKRNGYGCFTTNDGVVYDGLWQMDNIVRGNIFNVVYTNSLETENWYFSGQINQFNLKFGRKVNLPESLSSGVYSHHHSIKSVIRKFITHNHGSKFNMKNTKVSPNQTNLEKEASNGEENGETIKNINQLGRLNIYIGSFSQNMYHKKGLLIDFKNHIVYFGGFEYGLKSSFGIEVRKNQIYIGFWRSGKPHGVGILFEKSSIMIENFSKIRRVFGLWNNSLFNSELLLENSVQDNSIINLNSFNVLDQVINPFKIKNYGEIILNRFVFRKNSYKIRYIGNWKGGIYNGKGFVQLNDHVFLQSVFLNGKLNCHTLLSIYNKKSLYSLTNLEPQLDMVLKFKAFHGYLEPEYFNYKLNSCSYLGIGNLILKNWKLRFIKAKVSLHGLETIIEGQIKSKALHGNSHLKIITNLDSDVIQEHSLEHQGEDVEMEAFETETLSHHMIVKINARFKNGFLDGKAFMNIFNSRTKKEYGILADQETIDEAISSYDLPKRLKHLFINQCCLPDKIETEIKSTDEETLQLIDVLFKIKKFKKGLFLDSFDDSDYLNILNSLQLKSVLLENPTLVLQTLNSYSFQDSLKVAFSYGTKLHQYFLVSYILHYAFNFYVFYTEDVLFEISKYNRIRMRFINRGVYQRTKCTILAETLNPKNMNFYTECIVKNSNGYLILDEFFLTFVRRGLLRLRQLVELSNMLVKMYEVVLETENKFYLKDKEAFISNLKIYVHRRVILSRIIIQSLVQLLDFQFEGALDNPAHHEEHMQSEEVKNMISSAKNNLDYLHHTYIQNDLDSSQVFENILTHPELTKNSLTVIEILSQFNRMDASQNFSSHEDLDSNQGLLNWGGLFKKKSAKSPNIAKDDESQNRDTYTRTISSVAFKDIDLIDRLIFWKQNYYKKNNIEVVFYDNLGMFDTGMETRKTNFSDDSQEDSNMTKSEKFVIVRENMRSNQDLGQSQHKLMYKTVNPLSFGIIFWERFFQCKEEELKEMNEQQKKGYSRKSTPLESGGKYSGSNTSYSMNSTEEKSYSLSRLLPYDLQSSINYLGFMIFLSASDYPSKFRILNKNPNNSNFIKEEQLFRQIRTHLSLEGRTKLGYRNVIDSSVLISQINSNHKAYKFLRFILSYCRSFNLVKFIKNVKSRDNSRNKITGELSILNEIGIGTINIFKIIEEVDIPNEISNYHLQKLISDFEILDIFTQFLNQEMKFRTVFYYDSPNFSFENSMFRQMVHYFSENICDPGKLKENQHYPNIDVSSYESIVQSLYNHHSSSVLGSSRLKSSSEQNTLSGNKKELSPERENSQNENPAFEMFNFINFQHFDKLPSKKEHLKAYKNLVLFKFMFVTYKRFILKNCCYFQLDIPNTATQIMKSLTVNDKQSMCDSLRQLLYHAVVLEYLTKTENLGTNSEDMKIIEDIFQYLFSTLIKDMRPHLNISSNNTPLKNKTSIYTDEQSSRKSSFEDVPLIQDCKLEDTFIEDCLTLLCKHLSIMDKRVIDYIYQIRKEETYFTSSEGNFVDNAKKGIFQLIQGKDSQTKSQKLIWLVLKIISKDLNHTRVSLAETVRFSSVRDVKIIEYGKEQEDDDDMLETNFLQTLKTYFCQQALQSQKKYELESDVKLLSLYREMSPNKHMILIRSLFLQPLSPRTPDLEIFKFNSTALAVNSVLIRTISHMVNLNKSFQDLMIAQMIKLKNHSQTIHDFYRMMSTMFLDQKNKISEFGLSPYVDSIYYLRFYKENLTMILKGICENNNIEGKSLVMSLEPETRFIKSLLKSLKLLLLTKETAQKDFKQQTLILRQLTELCQGGFYKGQEYVTNIHFEDIFDVDYILNVSDSNSLKFERDYYLVEFYLAAIEKKRGVLIDRIYNNPGLYRPYIKLVLIQVLNKMNKEVTGTKQWNTETVKKIQQYFKLRHLERAEDSQHDTMDEYFWGCAKLEKYYRYLILLYKFYWSVGFNTSSSEIHNQKQQEMDNHLNDPGVTESSERTFQEQVFDHLRQHFKSIQLKDSSGEIVTEIFPSSPYLDYIDKDFENQFLNDLDPENDDNLFLKMIDQLEHTEKIIKSRPIGKKHFLLYSLTTVENYNRMMFLNLILSYFIIRYVFVTNKKGFWKKAKLYVSSFFLWLICLIFIILTITYRYRDIEITSNYNFLVKSKRFDFLNLRKKLYFFQQILHYAGGMIFHLFISWLGFYISDWFFSFHLLISVNIFKGGRFIIQAITRNSSMFLTTLVYTFILLIPYSHIEVLFYSDKFDIVGNINPCDTLWECFLYNANLGIRNGGGIGDVMTPGDFDKGENTFIKREIFEVSYFIVINTIMFGIFTGLIIDAFAAIREQSQIIEQYSENICPVCLQTRSEILRTTRERFDEHRKEVHSVRIYFMYFMYVRDKNKLNRNGIETYVFDCLEERKLDFLPRLD